MDGRRRVPFILLGLLTLLAAGAVVLGLRSSPPGANITVSNATAATYGSPLGSTSFTLDLTSAVSGAGTSGVISQVRRVQYSPPSSLVVYQTHPQVQRLGAVPAKGINGVLTQYAEVTLGPGTWARHGTELTRTESLPAFTRRVTPGKPAVHGTVYETAIVQNGYLVYVGLRVVVPQQSLGNGQTAAGGTVRETYLLLRINGQAVPAVNLP